MPRPLPLIGASELARALPMNAAIDALERAFRSDELPQAPLRSRVEVANGELLLMPASGAQGVGVKLVTLNPSNPGRGMPFIHAVYVLFDPDSLEPSAVIDGAALTALRTAAVSGVATKHLALQGVRRLVLFGAGVQATSHLYAMLAARPSIREVTVVSRSPDRASVLVERAREAGLTAGLGAAESVSSAGIVCTCTTSSAPLFDGSLLEPGAHVNAVGSYQPTARELDTSTVTRSRVVVETREAALSEAGDLLIPIGEGAFRGVDVSADLSEVVRGAVVRQSPLDITVFKSVGVAFEDLVVASAAREALDAPNGSGQ